MAQKSQNHFLYKLCYQPALYDLSISVSFRRTKGCSQNPGRRLQVGAAQGRQASEFKDHAPLPNGQVCLLSDPSSQPCPETAFYRPDSKRPDCPHAEPARAPADAAQSQSRAPGWAGYQPVWLIGSLGSSLGSARPFPWGRLLMLSCFQLLPASMLPTLCHQEK